MATMGDRVSDRRDVERPGVPWRCRSTHLRYLRRVGFDGGEPGESAVPGAAGQAAYPQPAAATPRIRRRPPSPRPTAAARIVRVPVSCPPSLSAREMTRRHRRCVAASEPDTH